MIGSMWSWIAVAIIGVIFITLSVMVKVQKYEGDDEIAKSKGYENPAPVNILKWVGVVAFVIGTLGTISCYVIIVHTIIVGPMR